MSQNTFSGFQSFEAFLDGRKATIDETDQGYHVLSISGQVAATISNKLKGSTLEETAAILRGVRLTLGLPHPGSKDNAGRPSLPCLLESKSTWKSIEL